MAWHERQVTAYLEQLAAIRDRHGNAADRLEAVLEAYALIAHEHHGTELAALPHRGTHIAHAQQQLTTFIRDLLIEAAKTGDLRDDVAPGELATYCIHSLTAATSLSSKAAVRRLVTVVLAGCARRAETDGIESCPWRARRVGAAPRPVGSGRALVRGRALAAHRSRVPGARLRPCG